MRKHIGICKTHLSRTLLLSFLAFVPKLYAEPRLSHLFSDHMVLQRDVEVHVWGWAEPGESIEVVLDGISRQSSASAYGRWAVTLPPHSAGGPFALEIRGKTTLRFKDVMFGEVWVASGQSNMTYPLATAAGGPEELLKLLDPGLRFFTVPRKIALEPQTDTLPAAWEICSSDTAKDFSAVAYFFARDLRRSLGVPVGVILSAWPGTAAEEWTDMESMRRDPVLQPIASRWDSTSAEAKAYAARPRPFSLEFDDFELIPAKTDSSGTPISNFDDGSSRDSMGGTWSYGWKGGPDTAFELISPGRGNKGYAARISGTLDNTTDSRWDLRLRPDDAPQDLSGFAGVKFWARGNGSFLFRTLQPTISDYDDYGSSLQMATSEWKEFVIWFKDLKQQGWGVVQKLTLDQISGFYISALTDLPGPPRPPSGLYEGMITPLLDYRVRGAIWYQGESNAQRAFQYRTLLPAMIHGWRAAWKGGDFPFLIVQLPNFGNKSEFGDSWWAELREAQFLTAKTVPNTGLAVAIDTGESWNLHPPRKAEIGQRLALWALATTYGKKLEYSGPLYESARIDGQEVRISFQRVGTGLQAHGDTLQGFAIAGTDKKFVRATARIDGNTVVVSSPEVAAPVSVRYAWADSPECNLFNSEGLPASPFRTDDWPGATFSKR